MPEQSDYEETPPADKPGGWGVDCEFCDVKTEATVRRELQVTKGLHTNVFVYACDDHRENARRFARARLGSKA